MPGKKTSSRPLVLVLNGPNLNLLGQREPDIYGHDTLADIDARMAAHAGRLGFDIDCRQSNAEHELIGWVQAAGFPPAGQRRAAAIIINPGAFTHTSVALLDALTAAGLPVIEVHLSNIHQREVFRHHSYVSTVARGVICGFRARGYLLALDALTDIVSVP